MPFRWQLQPQRQEGRHQLLRHQHHQLPPLPRGVPPQVCCNVWCILWGYLNSGWGGALFVPVAFLLTKDDHLFCFVLSEASRSWILLSLCTAVDAIMSLFRPHFRFFASSLFLSVIRQDEMPRNRRRKKKVRTRRKKERIS